MNQSFKDLYEFTGVQLGQHPPFTTYKYRKDEGWNKRTIDYIFMANNTFDDYYRMRIMQRLDPGQIEQKGLLNNEIGYPVPDYPSDHFSIGY